MPGDNNMELFLVRQRLSALEDLSKKVDHTIFGNGRPGLIQDVADVKASAEYLRKTADALKKDAELHRRSQVRFNDSVESMVDRVHATALSLEKTVMAVSLKVNEVEKTLKPIVDWKRGIIIRLTTMAGTLSAVIALIVFLIENQEVIKKFFKGL